MSDGNETHLNSFRATGVETRTVLLFFGVSFLIHVAFVIIVVLSPDFHLFMRKPLPPVMQVALVQLPGGIPAPGPAASSPEPSAPAPAPKKPPKEAVKAPEPKPEPVAEPQPKPEKKPVPVEQPPEPEFKKKVSLKEETKKKDIPIEKPEKTPPPKPEPEPEPAKKEPPKPAGPTSEELLSKAMENLKQKVAKSGPPSAGVPGTASTGSGAGGVIGGTDRGGDVIGTVLQLYEQDVGNRVQQNWAYSNLEGSGEKNLEAILGIKINANGEITDVWFDQKSGNTRLDDSAYNAIKKSNPLPKLPAGEKEYKMGIRFNPQNQLKAVGR
jgi:colicin import membrane protein